eukprot:280922-Amphidinium_carterae.1
MGKWSPRSKKGQKADSDKGSGRSSTGPEGWHCSFCKFYNFSRSTVCLRCKTPKGTGVPPAGGKSKNNNAASKDAFSEQLLKKQ